MRLINVSFQFVAYFFICLTFLEQNLYVLVKCYLLTFCDMDCAFSVMPGNSLPSTRQWRLPVVSSRSILWRVAFKLWIHFKLIFVKGMKLRLIFLHLASYSRAIYGNERPLFASPTIRASLCPLTLYFCKVHLPRVCDLLCSANLCLFAPMPAYVLMSISLSGVSPPTLFLFFRITSAIFVPWPVSVSFRISWSVATKSLLGFDWRCIKSTGQFGENWHLCCLLVQEHNLSLFVSLLFFQSSSCGIQHKHVLFEVSA